MPSNNHNPLPVKSYLFIALIWPIHAQAQTNVTVEPQLVSPGTVSQPAKTKNAIAPTAYNVLDKAAKFYSGLKTLKLKASGSFQDSEGKHTDWSRLTYATGNRIYLESKGTYTPNITVINGVHVSLWDGDEPEEQLEQFDMGVSGTMDARKMVSSAAFPMGLYLSDWLQGKHYLQPNGLKELLGENGESLTATYHPPSRVGNQLLENVEVSVIFRGKQKLSGVTWKHTLWFVPKTGCLVRINYQGSVAGKKTQGSISITAQEFNTALPASAFAFKKPA